MNARQQRREQYTAALASASITSSGRDFLIASLDPMHDAQLKDLQGWPDVETSSSVVRCIKQSITISAPKNTTGNWDAHIVLWPWFDQLNMARYRRSSSDNSGYNSCFATTGVSGTTNRWLGDGSIDAVPMLGGCQVFSGTSGTSFSQLLQQPATIESVYESIVLDPSYSKGASRIVGAGFEIVNTTAEIYRQGQLCVYRQPFTHTESFTPIIRTTNPGGPTPPAYTQSTGVSFQWIRTPPENFQEAMLIPGSRQWKASDGAYVVASFVGQDNPPKNVSYVNPVFPIDTYYSDGSSFIMSKTGTEESCRSSTNFKNDSGVVAASFYCLGDSLTTANNMLITQPTKIYPINTSGALLTGLSPQTTFTLTCNIYVESFPTVDEKDILVLATPSAVYNPPSLELFSNLMSVMPVGVPAGDNASGDWWQAIVDAAAEVVPVAAKVASMIPGGGIVSTGLDALGSVAKQYATPQSPQSRPVLAVKKIDTQVRAPVKRVTAPVPKKKKKKIVVQKTKK